MPDLTPERLAGLRALAESATPGPWAIDSYTHYDIAPPTKTWSIPGLERWNGLPNNVHFGTDEATARYVAAVSPDVVTALLDEITRLRSELAALVEVAAGACSDETAHDPGVMALMRYLAAKHPVEAAPEPTPDPDPTGYVEMMTALGRVAGVKPTPPAAREPDKVVDLMEALERSVAAAKDARQRGTQPTNREDA